ncbi:MAG TPA: Fe-S cluster assembly protein SufD [Anaerolineae bacterium]|nr:Fe-S cluster assembly protein SufD [Anaerolineae bacterium]
MFTQEAVEKLSASLNEPQWMLDLRLAAFEQFTALPMPTTSDEPWRRTTLRRFKINTFSPSINGDASTDATVPSHMAAQLTEDTVGGVLVQIDGVTQRYEISAALQEQGVIFCDMSTAVSEHPELVQKHFMTEAVKADEGKFAALHAAFWRGGTFLYVPKNVKAVAPLHSALWSQNGHTFTHTLVLVEQGAEVVILDEYESAESPNQAIHNGVLELLVRDNANLTYIGLQDFAKNMWQFNHECGRVGRDGKLNWVTSIMGSRLTKAFQTIELDGQGAYAQLSGLFFTDGRQHFDLDTQQNHNAGDTVSDLLYKGALRGKSRSVWQGMIKVLPDSQRIDGFQANRNLLLDSDARADSIPGLEIQADDVACTHASTIGKIQPEEIFYLMSRGIEENIARQILVEGFFNPVMARIPFEGVRDRIAERILEKARAI